MLIFRCVPVYAIWDSMVPNTKCNIDSTRFFFATITTHFLMDVAILLLPIWEISKLRMKTREKFAIIGFFMLGIM